MLISAIKTEENWRLKKINENFSTSAFREIFQGLRGCTVSERIAQRWWTSFINSVVHEWREWIFHYPITCLQPERDNWIRWKRDGQIYASRQPWFSQFSHFAFSFHFEASSIYIRETFSFRSNDLFVDWAATRLNLQF